MLMMQSKLKRALYRATRATAVVAILSLCVALYFRTVVKEINQPHSIAGDVMRESPSTSPSSTIWDLIQNDSQLSEFSKYSSYFPDIRQLLSSTEAEYTLFAPVNSAFEQERFDADEAGVYWNVFVHYHISPGSFSKKDLAGRATVSSLIFADIFRTYEQQIGLQVTSGGDLALNYRSSIVVPDVKASNGYIHYVNRVLVPPESTADALRQTPNFSIFRRALIQTGIAVTINDTNSHSGQTIFAPSNTAFKRLGAKVNRFLFSPWGNQCLKALVEYHIVANRTLFTGLYFKEKRKGAVVMGEGDEIQLPTMIEPLYAKSTIGKDGSRRIIRINDDINVAIRDIIVQDGVIHGVETVLLPPRPDKNADNMITAREGSWWDQFVESIFGPWGMTVEEIMDRFRPYLADGEDWGEMQV